MNFRPPRKGLAQLGLVALLTSVAMLLWFDSFPEKSLARNDFCELFYVAGTMVRDGLGSQLYPQPGFSSLAGTPFDTMAHRLFPGMLTRDPVVFLYPPPAAVISVPYSLLPARISFIAWQATCLAALFASAY